MTLLAATLAVLAADRWALSSYRPPDGSFDGATMRVALRILEGLLIGALLTALYAAGSNVGLLYLAVFLVYWCYGTQLSVNGAAASDFWGTKNAGINYGLLFTAWGVAGIIGPRIAGVLYDKYHNYQAAFYTAAALAAIALLCELLVKRPSVVRVSTSGADVGVTRA